MILQVLVLAAAFCLGAGVPPHVDGNSHESVTTDDDGTAIDISGKYRWVGEDGDWVYFMLGNVGIAIKKANFPNPPPVPGQQMTATGCTPDPGWPGGYICTGLS
jgi:hypothetical protein